MGVQRVHLQAQKLLLSVGSRRYKGGEDEQKFTSYVPATWRVSHTMGLSLSYIAQRPHTHLEPYNDTKRRPTSLIGGGSQSSCWRAQKGVKIVELV